MSIECGGCKSPKQKHKKHCRLNPTFSEAEKMADQLKRMGNFASNWGEYELANSLWRNAEKIREIAPRELARRKMIDDVLKGSH